MKIITYCEECFEDLMKDAQGELAFFKTVTEYYIHTGHCIKYFDHDDNFPTKDMVEFLECIGLLTTTEHTLSVVSIRPNGVKRLAVPQNLKSSHCEDVYEICFDENHANIFELEENYSEE